MRAGLELPVTRIGHGVRAIEDPALVEELARARIVLECCPTSNVVLGLFPSYEEHPLPRLADAGVKVTLGSDDPPYFGASIGGEYAIAASASASTTSGCAPSLARPSRPHSAKKRSRPSLMRNGVGWPGLAHAGVPRRPRQ